MTLGFMHLALTTKRKRCGGGVVLEAATWRHTNKGRFGEGGRKVRERLVVGKESERDRKRERERLGFRRGPERAKERGSRDGNGAGRRRGA